MDLSQLVTGQSWTGVCYGTTTRNMPGVSQAPFDQFNLGLHCGDVTEHAMANRLRLEERLPSRPIWLNQVHGTEVLDADGIIDSPPTADAVVTTQIGKVLAIMTADCLPVVIADQQGSIVGAAHAGWRGLQAGVLERLVDTMRSKKPHAILRAWIGPAISQPVFEVGAEVYDAFVKEDPTLATYFIQHRVEANGSNTRFAHDDDKQFKTPAAGKYLADLAGIAQYKLSQKGVHSIEQSGECTYLQQEKYFSYRRENPTGRIVTLAWLTGQDMWK